MTETQAPVAIEGFRGALLASGDDGYEQSRFTWNAMFDRRPALIARCSGVADVIAGVNYARDNGMLLSAQRRLSSGFSVLTNYTLSKCMTDPATTELTGPSITDPTNPGLDYSACDSDRRHVVNVSVVARVPSLSNAVANALFGSWQVAPLVRWQSGSPYSVTTGVDNALSGTGNQRAVQTSDNIYGDKSVNNYLNIGAFTSPAAGTYSTLKPNAFYGPSRFQNDLALTRNFRLAARQLQFRWEIFNVLNKANFNNPPAALNSTNFGRILTAGDPRIMQFALKFDF